MTALTLCGSAAGAWNGIGHMTVAEHAYRSLTASQRQAAYDILQKTPGMPSNMPSKSVPGFSDWDAEYKSLIVFHPNISMDEKEFVFLKAATWPDDIRNGGQSFPYNHPERHFINTPYVPAKDVDAPAVPTPNVITQIKASLTDLAPMSTATPQDRAAALCWLIHLTGDISQPLHCATLFSGDLSRLYTDGTTEGDRGGNRLAIRNGNRTGELHAFWDDLLGQTTFGAHTPQEWAVQDYPAIGIAQNVASQFEKDTQYRRDTLGLQPSQTPEVWAGESYALALSDAYAFHGQPLQTAFLKGPKSVAGFPAQSAPSLPAGYADNAKSVAWRQIAKAGYRLSDELAPLLSMNLPPALAVRLPAVMITADAEVHPIDPSIEALNLTDVAKAAAYQLKQEHPDIVFTSGRRTVAEQAHAMASNIVSSGNRQWIAKTYASAGKLQQWVDDHPDATIVDDIAVGLQAAMDAMTSDERAKVSKHLTGQAFDVQPVTDNADQIKADIRALPGLTKFLEKEGGLTRWHAQF